MKQLTKSHLLGKSIKNLKIITKVMSISTVLFIRKKVSTRTHLQWAFRGSGLEVLWCPSAPLARQIQHRRWVCGSCTPGEGSVFCGVKKPQPYTWFLPKKQTSGERSELFRTPQHRISREFPARGEDMSKLLLACSVAAALPKHNSWVLKVPAEMSTFSMETVKINHGVVILQGAIAATQ